MSKQRKSLTPAQATGLTAPSEPWMSCDDCFEVMDHQVEAMLDAIDLDPAIPEAFRRHLANCPACYAEVEGLLCVSATDRGLSERSASKSLRTAVHPRSGRPWRSIS
ncbi:MAG: anti-sigma factor family protein [Acidimicrobiales bacterium]